MGTIYKIKPQDLEATERFKVGCKKVKGKDNAAPFLKHCGIWRLKHSEGVWQASHYGCLIIKARGSEPTG
jgi:hypothetical protein